MKRKNNSSSFKDSYSDSFKFIKESKNYILTTIILFLVFALYGYFANIPMLLEDKILELLRQVFDKFQGLNVYQTIWTIFSNNLMVSFMAMILGVVFGIFPLFATISNGFLIGFVAKKVVAEEGIFILWKLLPHGIFELPAVFIAISLGIKFGFELFKKDKFKYNLKNSFQVFFYIVLPLLLIAAIIEGVLIYLVS